MPARGGLNDIDLERYCMSWILEKDASPIALLGSYGTGKTTFLLHLANSLVEAFKRGACSRMPIYIPLHELCSEQSLEGLLGRHFTGLHQVPHYSFGTFCQLNVLGTFVLLLDGFDEMKHAMTTPVFRFTFQEILRMISPNCKTILSGRPTAFLSHAERDEFLHASLTHKGRVHRMSTRPDFTEVHLTPFKKNQIKEFVAKYRVYVADLPAASAPKRILTDEDFFQSQNIMELAERPVQLRMLFDVLPAYEKDPNQLTVRELYTFFVTLLLEREARKPARRRFASEERKAFHEHLAFYMWQATLSAISIASIPEECLPDSIRAGDMQDAVRDLLSGSLLETRYPDQLYFPHRSIQEFLVAEYLLSYFRNEDRATRLVPSLSAPLEFGFIENHISPEVIDFMIAAAGKAERRGGLQQLSMTRSPVSAKSLRFWLKSEQGIRELVEYVGEGNHWALALLLFAKSEGWKAEPELEALLFDNGRKLIMGSADRDVCYRAFFLNWMLCSLGTNASDQHRELGKACVALLEVTEDRVITRSGVDVSGKIRPPYVFSLLEEICRDPTNTDTREKEKEREWEHTTTLYLVASKRRLFGAASPVLRFFGWQRPDSLKLIETVKVDEELKALLVTRYDEDQLNPGKWTKP